MEKSMNATAHQVTAALSMGLLLHSEEAQRGESTAWPIACAGVAALATNLPDVLEPAMTPNHRQFFHSLLFAGILGYGLYRLYGWDAETSEQKLLRTVGLVAGGAYLVRLALDATTKRSLPLVGRLPEPANVVARNAHGK